MGVRGLIIGTLWIGSVIVYRIEPVPWYNDVDDSDTIASILCQETEPVWLEGLGSDLRVSPQSVGVSMFTKRCVTPIANRPTDDIWVVVSIKDGLSIGQRKWVGKTHELRRISSTDWLQVPLSNKWSLCSKFVLG